MPTLTSHHVGLAVSSMQRALDFFCGVLGMKVLLQREITTPWVANVNGLPPVDLHVAFLDGYGRTLELLEFVRSAEEPAPAPASCPGIMHLAFLVDDLDAAVAEFGARGARFVSQPQTNTEGPNAGSQVVFMHGPDNVRIELVQSPPGRRQMP